MLTCIDSISTNPRVRTVSCLVYRSAPRPDRYRSNLRSQFFAIGQVSFSRQFFAIFGAGTVKPFQSIFCNFRHLRIHPPEFQSQLLERLRQPEKIVITSHYQFPERFNLSVQFLPTFRNFSLESELIRLKRDNKTILEIVSNPGRKLGERAE